MIEGKGLRRGDIRPAIANELALVRRLMPSVYTSSSAPDQVLVAVDPDSREIIGAAAIAWRAWGQPPGFPLYVHVAEPHRRRGLGRALVRAAAIACEGETERFHNWATIDEGAEEALFARTVGFDVNRRVLNFEADVLPFFQAIDAIYQRLCQRGKMPSDVRTAPLGEVPAAPVARLVSTTFSSRYDLALSSIQPGSATYDRTNSVVLLVRGEVGGVLLCRWDQAVPEIDVRVVAPQFQKRWANLAMLRHITRSGAELGTPRFRFKCDDANTDTISLARRTNAFLRRTTVEYSAPLQELIAGAGTVD